MGGRTLARASATTQRLVPASVHWPPATIPALLAHSVDLLRGLVRPGGREPSTCPGHTKLSHASDPNGPLPVGVALFAAVTGAFDVREIPVQLARSSALVIILAALAAVLHLP